MMKRIAGNYVKSKLNTHHNKLTEIPPINTHPFPASTTVPEGLHARGVHVGLARRGAHPARRIVGRHHRAAQRQEGPDLVRAVFPGTEAR